MLTDYSEYLIMKTSIIVASSALQLIAAEQIIKNHRNEKFIVYLSYSNIIKSSIENIRFIQTGFSLKSLISLYKFKKEIKSLTKNENPDIYIGHLYNHASNYIFNKSRNSRLFLLPDGILNYRKDNCIKKFIPILIIKKIIGIIFFIPFKIPKTMTNYDDNRFHGNFVFGKTLPVTQTGITCFLNIDNDNQDTNKGTILYLDQPFRKKEAEYIIEKIREFIRKIDCDTIYYKAHPHKNTKNYLADYNAITIENSSPSEKIIGKINPEYIISYNSSALLTAKLINPKIKAIAIHKYDTSLIHLDEYFISSGVEVYYI